MAPAPSIQRSPLESSNSPLSTSHTLPLAGAHFRRSYVARSQSPEPHLGPAECAMFMVSLTVRPIIAARRLIRKMSWPLRTRSTLRL